MEEAGEKQWSGGGAAAVLGLSPGSSIPISYHPSFGPHDDLLLLEVDEKLLPDILHNRATIRGQANEDAVLCTSSATYAMKFVGTSNSVFLIPPGDPTPSNSLVIGHDGKYDNPEVLETGSSVIKLAPGSLELIQAAPKLDKLKALLNERPYKLEDELLEYDDTQLKTGLYRWEDLVELIQASEQELLAGLRSLSAVEINGYWRIVDRKYMDEALDMILRNSILKEWSHHALEEDCVIPVLEDDGFPPRIVLHCLEIFGDKVDGHFWSLDEKRVCLRFAARILNGGKMKLDSFKGKWMRSIPSGMTADLRMLEGHVLYEKIGVEDWIRAFSVADLPSSPAERFSALFQERPKWEWKDLEPYIRDLRVPGLTSEGLLIKYTRRTQPRADAEPILSAR